MSMLDLFDHLTAKPVTCTWIIDKFYERMQNIGSSKMSSPETKLSEGAFNLYLTRNSDTTLKNIVISFEACDYVPEFYYRISLIKEGQKWKPQEGRADSFEYKIWYNYFNFEGYGLLPDGKLTVYCEIFELKNSGIKRGLNNLISLSNDNQSLLDSGDLSDVVVAVGGREFKAHKLILSSRSIVFKKMFEHKMLESSRNRVEIEDMSAGVCEDMLRFIYTGKVGHLNENVYELYAASDKYQIDSLKSYCELHLELSLSPATVPEILQFVKLHSLENLKTKCLRYIALHLPEFELKDFVALATLHPDAIYPVSHQAS